MHNYEPYHFLPFQFKQFGSDTSRNSFDHTESARFFYTKPFLESSSGIGSEFFVEKRLIAPSQRAVRNGSDANGPGISKVFNLFLIIISSIFIKK